MREKILAQFPDHPVAVKIWIARGDAFSKQGRPAEAVKAYEKAGAKLSPVAKQKLETARKLLLASAGPDASLDIAAESLTASDTTTAITLYLAWLQKNPNATRTSEAKTKLGWCYSLQNTPESLKKAEDLWQAVIQKGPANDPWAGDSQWSMIQLLAGPKGKWEDAVKLCEVVAKNFPKSARAEQALFTRAWLYWAHQRWHLGRAAFEDYLRAYPEAIEHPPVKTYIRDCDEGISLAKKP
jgi:tetratricopeptide (TPR) repeat protein